MTIGTPVLLGTATTASGNSLSITPSATTNLGDMIVAVVTEYGDVGNPGSLSDSEGNLYALVSLDVTADIGVFPSLFIEVFVSLYSVPIGPGSTVTWSGFGSLPNEGVFQLFSVSGVGPADGYPLAEATDSASSFDLWTPNLQAPAEIVFGVVAAQGTSVTLPDGWTSIASTTGTTVAQRVCYQAGVGGAPAHYNPALGAGSHLAVAGVCAFFGGPMPAVCNPAASIASDGASANALAINIANPLNAGDLVYVLVAQTGTGLVAPTVTTPNGPSGTAPFTLGTSIVEADRRTDSFYFTNPYPTSGTPGGTFGVDISATGSSGITFLSGRTAVFSTGPDAPWIYGYAGAGDYANTASPSFTSGTLPTASGVAIGSLVLDTSLSGAITDPTGSEGWGFVGSFQAHSQVVEPILVPLIFAADSALTFNPTLADATEVLTNIETFSTGTPVPITPPAGREIMFADFVNGVYRLNGSTCTLADLFTQSGSVTGSLFIDGLGLMLKVCTSGSSALAGVSPVATAGLITAVNAGIDRALTIDATWTTDPQPADVGAGATWNVLTMLTGTDHGYFIQDEANGQYSTNGGGIIDATDYYFAGESINPFAWDSTGGAGWPMAQSTRAVATFTPTELSFRTFGTPDEESTIAQDWPLVTFTLGDKVTYDVPVHPAGTVNYPNSTHLARLAIYTPIGGFAQTHILE